MKIKTHPAKQSDKTQLRPLNIIEKIYLKEQLSKRFSRFVTVTAIRTLDGIKWGAFGLGTYFGRGVLKID